MLTFFMLLKNFKKFIKKVLTHSRLNDIIIAD